MVFGAPRSGIQEMEDDMPSFDAPISEWVTFVRVDRSILELVDGIEPSQLNTHTNPNDRFLAQLLMARASMNGQPIPEFPHPLTARWPS